MKEERTVRDKRREESMTNTSPPPPSAPSTGTPNRFARPWIQKRSIWKARNGFSQHQVNERQKEKRVGRERRGLARWPVPSANEASASHRFFVCGTRRFAALALLIYSSKKNEQREERKTRRKVERRRTMGSASGLPLSSEKESTSMTSRRSLKALDWPVRDGR